MLVNASQREGENMRTFPVEEFILSHCTFSQCNIPTLCHLLRFRYSAELQRFLIFPFSHTLQRFRSLPQQTHCQCSTPSRKIQLLWLQLPPRFLQCGIQASSRSPVANTTSTSPSRMSSPNAHSFSFPFAVPRTSGSAPSMHSKATGKVPEKMQMLQTCTFH